MCHCINLNNNTTITHHSIQKWRTAVKGSSMGSFKVSKCFCHLNWLFEEQTAVRAKFIDVYTCIIAVSNVMRTPSGSFVSQWHKKHTQLHTLYTNACILIPVMTFYDAKPWSVKTPVAAKPSGVSPNHPCQCSLVILSYYISPSHFFTADHL